MKTARSRCLSSLLLLLQTSLLMTPGGCSASSYFEILRQPVSQVVKVEDSATFHCSASAVGVAGSFDLVLTTSFRTTPIYINYNIRLEWMTAAIHSDYNDQTLTYTARVTVTGSEMTNGTSLRCRMFSFEDMNDALFSNAAELTVIGPPDTPARLSLPEDHVNMELGQFSVEWNVPFSHINHSISHYNVTVNSPNDTVGYVEPFPVSPETGPPLPTSGPVTVTLPFPPRTTSCDILNISVTAVNDIGASQPASAVIFIRKVPDVAVTATFITYSGPGGRTIILTEIKFPKFCWFERVNYSVLLEERGGEGRQLVLIEGAVNNPQEPVIETISAGLVSNGNYSVVVSAQTDLWNSSTTPHTFTSYTPNAPTTLATDTKSTDITPSVEGISSDSEDGGVSFLVVGIVSASVVCLLILIVSTLAVICALRSRNRRPNLPITLEDMKLSRAPLELTPNPIYGGPLYETVGDAVPHSQDIKPELYPLPLTSTTALSVYTESPKLSKHRQINGNEEETYVQMNSCNRK